MLPDGSRRAQGLDGEIVARVRDLARRHGVWILGGTFPERGDDSDRVFNTSVLVSDEGALAAVYRKIHLFDVDLGDQGGGSFRESATVAPGDEVVVAQTPFGAVGLSVCYDLRFPELYRAQSARGARFLTVPAAFARETGRDHWEVLLRARAIENLCWVVAPAQVGVHNEKRQSHGETVVIDPWGTVTASRMKGEGVVRADIDLARVEEVRRGLPCHDHARPELFSDA